MQKEVEEWSRRMQEAVCSIQDITVDYFRETVKALAGNLDWSKGELTATVARVFITRA